MDLIFPPHADWRAASRGLNETDIEYILLHGQRIHRDGALFYFLRRRDIPRPDRANQRWARLEGSAVVINQERGMVITVWRNRRRGLKVIRRKPDFERPDRSMPLAD